MTTSTLDQVRKLIALAVNNPAEEEARSAARKACVLIQTHRLVLREPPAQTEDAEADADVPGWEKALVTIEQMRGNIEFHWAHATLTGIGSWVLAHHTITARQWRAVCNIRRCR